MNDDNLTVVQGNDLIEGTHKVSIDEYRLLNLALSKVDSVNPQPNQPYVLTTNDFQEVYGASHKTHEKLKSAARLLMKKPIITYQTDHKTKKSKTVEIAWFSMIKYDNSAVELYFSEFVRPYLYELKKNFTSVMFKNLAKLDTPFSIRLYLWLSKFRNFKKNKTVNGTIYTDIQLDWMRERGGLENKYTDYRILRRRLIEPAIEKINKNTDISVSFDAIKQGRTIVGIRFFYILEGLTKVKPVRKRLPRRPHVKHGSDAEGKWARECINLMSEYDLELVDAGYKLEVGDLRKLQSWYAIIGDKFAIDEIEQEISGRLNNKYQNTSSNSF